MLLNSHLAHREANIFFLHKLQNNCRRTENHADHIKMVQYSLTLNVRGKNIFMTSFFSIFFSVVASFYCLALCHCTNKLGIIEMTHLMLEIIYNCSVRTHKRLAGPTKPSNQTHSRQKQQKKIVNKE